MVKNAKEFSNDHVAKRKLLMEHSEGHVFEYTVDEGKSQMELVNDHVNKKETATVEPTENKHSKSGYGANCGIPHFLYYEDKHEDDENYSCRSDGIRQSDTIRKLKANFSETEGVSMMNLKKLFFGANSLDSDKKLGDYGIKEGSTLNLFLHSGAKIQIYVRLSQSSKTITLEVDTMDTIRNIKAKIQSKEGITNQHDLIYLGEELDESRTLAAYNIETGSILYAVFQFGDVMEIGVSIEQDMRTINLKVKSWYTIKIVKNVIESMEGIEADKQRLYIGEVKLENDGQLLFLLEIWFELLSFDTTKDLKELRISSWTKKTCLGRQH
ncbi:hypothetical protein IFM89_025803 [Coptis chinensis]|uniref:Ubiquitin-like domain-containing protein n=1 Tax=Coptis chinensis TaxID=261450 RepID=A0A835HE56_9MAGN|nr:hypothetical protein IFM89_025803 [Coptis chinensis]